MIEFDRVAYSYGQDALLDNVSMILPQGSFHFLTGPSGVGKTTLVKLCYGALTPARGRVRVFGRDINQLDRDGVAFLRRNIGVVHQDGAFLDHLSIAENIILPFIVSGHTSTKVRNNLHQLLGWVGLKEVADQRPPYLSGGERQRAALARALINAPDVILADEPTGNIDWEMSQRLIQLLVELNKMGKTILIATHDLTLIRYTKNLVQARVLRIHDHTVGQAGADL